MPRTSILWLLAACTTPPELNLPDSSVPPPGPCALQADHYLSPRIVGQGAGNGVPGGYVEYSSNLMFSAAWRNVAAGDTISLEIPVNPAMNASREDLLFAQLAIYGGAGGVGAPMPVIDTVWGGSLPLGPATAQLVHSGGTVGLSWAAEIGPFTYGDDHTCVGTVMEVPTIPGMPATFDIELSGATWTTHVAEPDHGRNPLYQGPLPPPDPFVRAQSCAANPIVIDLEDATPNGDVAVVTGAWGGATIIPSGPCAGTSIPLRNVRLRATGTADGSGYFSFIAPITRQQCQAAVFAGIDLTTCNVGTP